MTTMDNAGDPMCAARCEALGDALKEPPGWSR